jgi:hypothetical protein
MEGNTKKSSENSEVILLIEKPTENNLSTEILLWIIESLIKKTYQKRR